jgi:hypothetical protein
MKKALMMAGLLTAAVFACSGSQKKEPKEPVYEEVDIESVDTGDEGSGPSCTDSSGEPIQCLGDDDCCEGFYCGIDPEGSTRIKVCIPGE